MFGRMMVTPILQVGRDADVETAIDSLLQAADQAEVVRSIEFPNSLLLFRLVPGDPESGSSYVLDRETGTWYSVDLLDQRYGGYSVSQLEQLLQECRFLDLAERPGFCRTGLNWWVEAGKRPEARV